MNGQMKSFKERQKIVDDFITRINPYEVHTHMRFDFHGYAKYVKENGLTNETITQSVMEQFQR